MSINKDEAGRRSIQVQVEVTGTPEQVWEAIASGPGVSSWFVPTRIDGRLDGEIVSTFGPGFDATARITEWRPPHSYTALSEAVGGQPQFASEWTVEARDGGRCVVRVVNSFFSDTDDWDDQLDGLENGWPAFFEILRLYLQEHRGERVCNVQLMTMGDGQLDAAWSRISERLGLEDGKLSPQADAPELVGEVARQRDGMLVLRLSQPAPGYASIGACQHAGKLLTSVALYLFGDDADAIGARETPKWQAWLDSM